MAVQGWQFYEHLLEEFLTYCNQVELAENIKKPAVSDKSKSNSERSGGNGNSRKRKRGKGGNSKNGKQKKKGGKFCTLHQMSDHDTFECRIINSQIKKMREN